MNVHLGDTPARCFFMFQSTDIHNGKYSTSHMTYQRRWNKIKQEMPRHQTTMWPQIHINEPEVERPYFNFRRLFDALYGRNTRDQQEIPLPGNFFYFFLDHKIPFFVLFT